MSNNTQAVEHDLGFKSGKKVSELRLCENADKGEQMFKSDTQKLFLDDGGVAVILKNKDTRELECCRLKNLDDLEQFALKHMDESPNLFEDLGLMLLQDAAHRMR
jgi:uncharacterized protein VirK/YbjX